MGSVDILGQEAAMSKLLALLTAMVISLGFVVVFASGAAAMSAPLSLHLQERQGLVLYVKKHNCEEGCWGCMKTDCLKHKHTEYCETPPAKAECCTKWKKECYCSPDFCKKQ